jgi:phosphoglycerate-specific signal transduction histidine kinase
MREKIQQLNHLAAVLYSESRNLDTVSKGKAQLYQDIIDEMQERLDSIMNEIIAAEQE